MCQIVAKAHNSDTCVSCNKWDVAWCSIHCSRVYVQAMSVFDQWIKMCQDIRVRKLKKLHYWVCNITEVTQINSVFVNYFTYFYANAQCIWCSSCARRNITYWVLKQINPETRSVSYSSCVDMWKNLFGSPGCAVVIHALIVLLLQ